MFYSELSVEERATIQIGHAQELSQRKIARLINRPPSTISRELRRNRDPSDDAHRIQRSHCSGERMNKADLAELVTLSKDFIFNVSACFVAAEEGDQMNTVPQFTEESLDSGDKVVSKLIDLVLGDVGVVPDEFIVAGMSSPIEQQLRGMTRIDAIQAFGEDGRISDESIDKAVVRASARIHATGTMEG